MTPVRSIVEPNVAVGLTTSNDAETSYEFHIQLVVCTFTEPVVAAIHANEIGSQVCSPAK